MSRNQIFLLVIGIVVTVFVAPRNEFYDFHGRGSTAALCGHGMPCPYEHFMNYVL
jgi:hypothetical protein